MPEPVHQASQTLALNSLILEYRNSFERSNKLDNKVYIVITFCGFLFVFITNLFSGLTRMPVPAGGLPLVLTVLYISLCLGVMGAYIGVLVFFLSLLRPEQIHRMDPEYVQVELLAALPEQEAVGRLLELYRETVNENLVRLHKRCDRFTKGLRYVACTVILAFAAYGVQILLAVCEA
ncbi:MAG: hypothetical protein SOW84_06565 [Candidatus Faecousia sp.]|nr:hypothetical protein [Candidatus Faecousia sp.]